MSVIWVYNAQEAADAVNAAAADGASLALRGRDTKRAFGRPFETARTLDLSRLAGAIRHDADDFLLTVKAGTPMTDIDLMLREHGQIIPFEPPDLGPFFGTPDRRGTIGGVLAADLCGPRAFHMGRPSDALAGFVGVNGAGEIYRASGAALKQATGLDLPRLMCGSFGILGPMVEITLKLAPAPASEDTVIMRGLTAPEALRTLRAIIGEKLDASGLAHLTGELALHLDGALGGAEGLTAIRFEGGRTSVDERVTRLLDHYRRMGPRRIGADMSHDLWKKIGALELVAREPGVVWRIIAPSLSAAAIASEIGPQAVQYDWGGTALWLVLDDVPHAHASLVRAVAARHNAEATLIRASEAQRATCGVFQPADENQLRDIQKLKAAFDPHGIFNPGRVFEGI